MPQGSADTPSIVEAELCFIVPQAEKPVFQSAAYTGGAPKIFFEIENRAVTITDLRKSPTQPSIEREGFELLRAPTAVADLNSDEAVENAYYPEIEALLKKRFGAVRVAIFDATRRSDSGTGAANPDGKRGPATRVHVDYTQKSGAAAAQGHHRRHRGCAPARKRRPRNPGQRLAPHQRACAARTACHGRCVVDCQGRPCRDRSSISRPRW